MGSLFSCVSLSTEGSKNGGVRACGIAACFLNTIERDDILKILKDHTSVSHQATLKPAFLDLLVLCQPVCSHCPQEPIEHLKSS